MTIVTADLESDGLEVTGQVIGQNDPAASCRLVVSQGQTSLDQSAEVAVSGSNSFCPLMVIDRDALTSGSWNIVIEYRGAASSGRSAVTTVDVP